MGSLRARNISLAGTMSDTSAREQVIALAAELGFDECRIATAKQATHAEVFDQWLADGTFGDMDWMAKAPERRRDPRVVLPGARSVIVLALNYFQAEPPADGEPGARGKVARYAWGDDYHDVIERRLKRFCAELKRPLRWGPSALCRLRPGARAGLRHRRRPRLERQDHRADPPPPRHLVLPRRTLTTLDLEPDPPSANYCGKCTRCIDCLPDPGDHGTAPARCPTLHLLPHHREQGADPRAIPPRDRRPDLRLRRLPRSSAHGTASHSSRGRMPLPRPRGSSGIAARLPRASTTPHSAICFAARRSSASSATASCAMSVSRSATSGTQKIYPISSARLRIQIR